MEKYREEEKTLWETASKSNIWKTSRQQTAACTAWLIGGTALLPMMGCKLAGAEALPGLLWINWFVAMLVGFVLHRLFKPMACNERVLGGLLGTAAVLLIMLTNLLQMAALMLGLSQSLTGCSSLNRHLQKCLRFMGMDDDEIRSRIRHIPAIGCIGGGLLFLYVTPMIFHARYSTVYAFLALVVALSVLHCGFHDPVDDRLLDKLDLYERRQAKGIESPALKNWLNTRITEPYVRPWFLLMLMQLLHVFYRHRVIGIENVRADEDNPPVFLANHGNLYGPVACKLYTPLFVRIWSISYLMLDYEEARDYLYKYTFSETKTLPKHLRYAGACCAARFALWGLKGLESIPVYRDRPSQLIKTFRDTVDVLRSGDSTLIFPENPNAVAKDHGYERSGVGELSTGFVMLAEIYYKRTGKCCRFIPMFAHQDSRTLQIGEEIVYCPDNDPAEERERLMREISDSMQAMASKASSL